MKCKNCAYMAKIANTDECGAALCTATTSYFPVMIDSECEFTPKPNTCKDCWRFGNDTACMTAAEDDNAENCPGFISKLDVAVEEAIVDWARRGLDVQKKFDEIRERAKLNLNFPKERRDD